MIKDILAIVEDGDAGASFLKTVGSFAKEQGAFLEVAALTPSPMVSPAIAPFGSLYVPEMVMIGSDAANVEAVRRHLADTGCEHEVIGLHDDMAWLAGDVRRSRQVADLIVVGTSDSWPTPWLRTRVLETVIRSAGTPIVILPTGHAMPAIRSAVLGWKPSPEANRAVHDLVRIAAPGASIDVVTTGDRLKDCEKERDTHDEVKRHLARHGFAAKGHWIVNEEQPESDTLMAYAQDIQADILVIGGFAHSRIRQIVLGSVTHDLVRRSDLPVLISG